MTEVICEPECPKKGEWCALTGVPCKGSCEFESKTVKTSETSEKELYIAFNLNWIASRIRKIASDIRTSKGNAANLRVAAASCDYYADKIDEIIGNSYHEDIKPTTQPKQERRQ